MSATPHAHCAADHTARRRAFPDAPRLTVGGVVFHADAVLLVQRMNPPNQGKWAIPGGRVHLGETLTAAVEREVMEETGVLVRAGDPIFVFDSIVREGDAIAYHYVVVDLLAEYLSGTPQAGDDASDARWVSASDLAQLNLSNKTLELLHHRFCFGSGTADGAKTTLLAPC